MPVIGFSAEEPFDFDEFLMEVGQRPSANHTAVCRGGLLPYEPGNMAWGAKTVEPPKPRT